MKSAVRRHVLLAGLAIDCALNEGCDSCLGVANISVLQARTAANLSQDFGADRILFRAANDLRNGRLKSALREISPLIAQSEAVIR